VLKVKSFLKNTLNVENENLLNRLRSNLKKNGLDVTLDSLLAVKQMQDKQMKIQAALRSQMIGKTYRVLVEAQNISKGIKKWNGRTSCHRLVHFEGDIPEKDYLWHWVDVEITSVTALSTQGKFIRGLGKNLT